mgnify:CR=1 FL=1
MRNNYVLIDWENVQPDSMELLDHEHVHVRVFVGAMQKDISIEKAAALQPMGKRVEYIRMARSGKNALDFHIAFYIGQIAATDTTAYFHIIAKDKGFDPLIEHLKSRKIFCTRSVSILDVPFVKTTTATTPEARTAVILEQFALYPKTRPATRKTLGSTIKNKFGKLLSDDDVDAVVKCLEKSKRISVDGTKVQHIDVV